MARDAKRRKLSGDDDQSARNHDVTQNGHLDAAPISQPGARRYEPPFGEATQDEKRGWKGFCDIESEPAFFNSLLRHWGVKGAKVIDLYSLDDEMLAVLPKPVYALIFLFRYRADAVNHQEASCPENVWFANQIDDHACATVSLLNIINNIRDPAVELSENLLRFKDFTRDFNPATRGEQIGDFEFVRQCHNSFARKMDMLSADLATENKFDNGRGKAKNAGSAAGKKSSATGGDDIFPDDDAAFHFFAYMPIDGDVWKLDGMDRQPVNVGKVPKPDSDALLEYEENQTDFVLLGMVPDDLTSKHAELAETSYAIQSVERNLRDSHGPLSVVELEPASPIAGSESVFGVKMDELSSIPRQVGLLGTTFPATAILMPHFRARHDLLDFRKQMIEAQERIIAPLVESRDRATREEQTAAQRRTDYGPLIWTWLKMLAEKEGVMKELVSSVKDAN